MIDLNALIQANREKRQAEEAALQRERQEAEAILREQEIAKFIELVQGELGAELLDALHPIYEARLHFKNASVEAQWHDDDSATDWTLGTRTGGLFTLKAANKHEGTVLNWDDIRTGTLRERLLSAIGFARDNAATKRAQAEAGRLAREQAKAEAERNRLVREEEEAALIAAADEIHAEIEALIEQRIAEERAKLWQWKRTADGNVPITLYTVKYCTGTRYVEDEAGSEFDYATGWALTDAFNEDGYITLMNGKPRHLLLDIYTHMPIWERHTFSSIDELPAALRERSGFVIDRITKRCFDDGKWRWIYDESEAWGCTAAPEGLPSAWVRALVDAAE